uniref:Cyclin N-terminal domain-containing protein n=1 Tax=viral metagenome TaxID=1070528 RepID=A0A6C0CK40_9ZZZZ
MDTLFNRKWEARKTQLVESLLKLNPHLNIKVAHAYMEHMNKLKNLEYNIFKLALDILEKSCRASGKPSQNLYILRLYNVCLLVAQKYLLDNPYNNSTWARYSPFQLNINRLNKFEVDLLETINWAIVA